MSMFLRLGNAGWYCVTKGGIFFRAFFVFLFWCFLSVCENDLWEMFFYSCSWVLSILYFFYSSCSLQKWFQRNLLLEALKLLLWWSLLWRLVGDTNTNSCIGMSVGLKWVRTSRIESLLNLTPLYTFVSKNVVSVSDISAMNLIVGWKLFAFRRNSSISFLLVSHTDMTSSINLFQKMGLMLLCLSISFSILAMKMLAILKATAIFVPMAVPWVWR